jgi:RIO kinase 1
MTIPARLRSLQDEGFIDSVSRQLMSGKEATVYVVRCGEETAQEAAWQSAEVDALYRLAAAGVRVPRPFNFHDGVLLMELVTDAAGDAAPRRA